MLGDAANGSTVHEQDLLENFGKLTGALGLFAGWLFFAGYEFLTNYFRVFRVPIWLLDLPTYMYPMHSVDAIVVLVIGSLACWKLTKWLLALERRVGRTNADASLQKKSVGLGSWVLVGVLVVYLSFFIVGLAAGLVGQVRASRYMAGNSIVVTLAFKTSTTDALRDEQLVKANKAGFLRMLTETKDLVIVYENTATKRVTTYVIARSELSSVRSSNIDVIP